MVQLLEAEQRHWGSSPPPQSVAVLAAAFAHVLAAAAAAVQHLEDGPAVLLVTVLRLLARQRHLAGPCEKLMGGASERLSL